MVDLNSTLGMLGPVGSTITSVVKTISYLVGGIFGLYLIYYIGRLIFARSLFRSVKEMKNYLKDIDMRMKNIEEDIEDYRKFKTHVAKHIKKKKKRK